jgi:hypothetical protein
MRRYRPRIDVSPSPPYLGNQPRPGAHPTLSQGKGPEQVKLRAGQADLLSPDLDIVVVVVNPEGPNLEYPRCVGLHTYLGS